MHSPFVRNAIRAAAAMPGQNSGSQSSTDFNVGQLLAIPIGRDIVKGDERGDRHGDKVLLTGFKINLSLRPTGSTSIEVGWMRVMILVSKRGSEAPETNLWKNSASNNDPMNFITTGNTLQLQRPVNNTKYVVLRDQIYPVNIVGSGSCNPKATIISMYQKFNTKLQYQDTEVAGNKCMPNIYFLLFAEREDGASAWTANPLKLEYFWTEYFREI
jgi:hypothetical protein